MNIFIINFNGVLDDLVTAVKADLVRDWRDAKVVVLWQDVMGECESIATQAKMAGKKVFVVEHGMLSINDYLPPLSRPLVADKFLAWGNWTKEWMVNKADIDSDKVVVTGTLLTKHMIPRRKHDDKRVLFAPRHWNGELKENLDIADELRKSEYTVFSKLLQGENNPASYPHPLSTDRQGYNHIRDCFSVLSWANVVVGLGEGTFGALAHLMDIPYISVDNWVEKDLLGKTYSKEEFDSQISKAAIKTPLSLLNKTIDTLIKNPDMNKEERKWFREECLNYKEEIDPLKKILEVIYSE